MSLHLLRLRWRRFWRRRKLAVQNGVHGIGETFERFGLARLGRLQAAWRFLAVWLGIVVLLGGVLLGQIMALRPYYQQQLPIPGGHYIEGVAGTFTTANPLYAVSDVDTSVARLVFASLLTYDSSGHLVGDLAESWRADVGGSRYIVTLRPNLWWQDGKPLTAADVVYTYQTIEDPDAQSPLYSSWHGITVAAVNARTVSFTLPNPLSSFPSSLTNGIVPKHILQQIDPVDLRSASFNTADPVGAGPFKWSSIGVSGVGDSAEAQISLTPFSRYWAGKPKLASFNVYTYADPDAMTKAYEAEEITAMVGLQSVPAAVLHDSQSHVYSLPLLAGVYVFFRTDSPVFSDAKVREALVLAANRTEVLHTLGYPTVIVDEPLLKGQLAYDTRYAESTGNLSKARALLLADGWRLNADKVWTKEGRELSFQLAVDDTPEYRQVAAALSREWASFGVAVTVVRQATADFQATLSGRDYDAALYGITIGSDPDVFVYWDSSQADPRSPTRLNFSDYQSAIADLSLESARTRLDPSLRVLKYRLFLQAWHQDAPALALYEPRLLYISHDHVYGLSSSPLVTDADRFDNVQNWMVNTGWITNP